MSKIEYDSFLEKISPQKSTEPLPDNLHLGVNKLIVFFSLPIGLAPLTLILIRIANNPSEFTVSRILAGIGFLAAIWFVIYLDVKRKRFHLTKDYIESKEGRVHWKDVTKVCLVKVKSKSRHSDKKYVLLSNDDQDLMLISTTEMNLNRSQIIASVAEFWANGIGQNDHSQS